MIYVKNSDLKYVRENLEENKVIDFCVCLDIFWSYVKYLSFMFLVYVMEVGLDVNSEVGDIRVFLEVVFRSIRIEIWN